MFWTEYPNPTGSSNPGSYYNQGQASVIAVPTKLVHLADAKVLFDANDGAHGAEPWIT